MPAEDLSLKVSSNALETFSTESFLEHLHLLGVEVRTREGKLQITAAAGVLTAGLQAELRTRKPAILEALHASVGADEEVVAPLTFAQERLWLIERFSPGTAAYNIPQSWAIEHAVDYEALTRALSALAQRHQALRTKFVVRGGEPVQIVMKQVELPVTFTDLSSETNDLAREATLSKTLVDAGRHRFDLGSAPLIRFHVIRLTQDKHLFFYNVHHIISDQWSLDILKKDLGLLYFAELAGSPSELPALLPRYTQVAERERTAETKTRHTRDLEYWRDRLDRMPQLLELPFSKSRPSAQTHSGKTHICTMDAGLTAKLRSIASQAGVSLFTLTLSIFASLLSRYTGQKDFCIGTPISGRKTREEEDMVGLFVNTLPLRFELKQGMTILEFVQHAQSTILSDFEHDVPFQKIVNELQTHRSSAYSSLFQVMFAFNPKRMNPEADQVETFIGISKFDLSLQIAEQTDTMVAHFEYRTDLYEDADVVSFAEHWEQWSRSIVDSPKSDLGTLSLLTPTDLQIIHQSNATELVYDQTKTLFEMFERQASLTPGHPAVYFENLTLTYAQLSERVDDLASLICSHQPNQDGFVAICLERTPDLIVSILAVLKAGYAYLPLDPNYPEDRLAYMLQDSGSQLLIAVPDQLSERLCATSPSLRQLSPSALANKSDKSNPVKAKPVRPGDAAYLIYTSGSTGKPKGVIVEHRNAVALIAWAKSYFGDSVSEVVLASTSVCFDLSIFEIFFPLLSGQALLLIKNILDLPRSSHAGKVTLLNTVPSAMNSLLQAGFAPTCLTVCLAGELLSAELVERVYAAGANNVIDLYGPTETTTYSTVARRTSDSPTTIGFPIANTSIYLVDQNLNPVPPGVLGEIIIGGDGVTRGYLKRPEITGERFITVPDLDPKGRFYRTGDLARQLSDGSLQFLGRRDQQVKLRGFRIELGEVEHALRETTGSKELAVVVQAGLSGEVLIGYIVPNENEPIDEPRTLASLRAKLPAYMVPTLIRQIPELPKTPNGKVDRKALSQTSESIQNSQGEPPLDLLEQWIANIWAQRLNRKVVARDEHFFDVLGGHSLAAFEIFTEIEKKIGVAMPLATLFQAPTVAMLATTIRRRAWNVPTHLSMLAAGIDPAPVYRLVNYGDANARDSKSGQTREMQIVMSDRDIAAVSKEILSLERPGVLLTLSFPPESIDLAEMLRAALVRGGLGEVTIQAATAESGT